MFRRNPSSSKGRQNSSIRLWGSASSRLGIGIFWHSMQMPKHPYCRPRSPPRAGRSAIVLISRNLPDMPPKILP